MVTQPALTFKSLLFKGVRVGFKGSAFKFQNFKGKNKKANVSQTAGPSPAPCLNSKANVPELRGLSGVFGEVFGLCWVSNTDSVSPSGEL